MEQIDSVADTEANSQTHEILLHVSHGGSVFDATLSADSTLDQLKETLEEITSVPAGRQKLLWKGMKRGAVNLEDSGLKNGSKVTLIGTPEKAIELMHQAEAEASRHAMILRAREASGPTKVNT